MKNETEERTIICHRCSEEAIESLFEEIRHSVPCVDGFVSTKYLVIGGVTFKLIVHDKKLLAHFTKELSYVISDSVAEHCDYTIVSWVTTQKKFSSEVHWVVEESSESSTAPIVEKDETNGRIIGYDDKSKCFYYCFPSSDPEDLAKEGHVFFRQFYRAFKVKNNASLVHGACVGIDGKGVLLCARGNRGKSTLCVLALLKGFEYVSDDYLTIEKKGNELFANPIYSIMTLSPSMYNEMFDELEGTRFISNNWNCSKYIMSIANHHDMFRTHYPIKACIIPEISDDEEPSIISCSPAEKGKAVASLVHSTITQMGDSRDVLNIKKIIHLLDGQSFYKIRLCRDIHRNVACLSVFLDSLSPQSDILQS